MRTAEIIAVLIMRDEFKDAVLGYRALIGSGIDVVFDPADICGEALMLADYLEGFFSE